MTERDHRSMLQYVAAAVQRPLMIMPEKLAVVAEVLSGRIGLDTTGLQQLFDAGLIAAVSKPAPAADRFVGAREKEDPNDKSYFAKVKPYRQHNGSAIINVHGSLVNRGAWVGSYSGMTSYEGLGHSLRYALRDSSISSIVLDVDSPGGEAVGAFETGQMVAAANKVKPVVSFVNGLCCSAAYALASAGSRIEATSTSIIGSIGVVMMHADYSKRLHDMGVKPTFIFAGKHKVDGNPYEPLSSSVKEDFQAEVNKFYDMFVAHVAEGRRGLSEKAVRNTEARTFVGSDAVGLKLADAIGTFEATLAGLQRRSIKRTNMTTEDQTPIYSQSQHEGLVAVAVAQARSAAVQETTQSLTATLTAQHNAALATARTEAVTGERGRISAIMALPEAKGREASAQHLALTTDMSAEAAKAVLAGLQPNGASKDSGIGLVVEKPKGAAAAPGAWDAALTRAGAKLPGQKTATA